MSLVNDDRLTLDVQRHRIALSVALLVAADTRVQPRTCPRDVLQHEALVLHDRAGARVVHQGHALQGQRGDNMNILNVAQRALSEAQKDTTV